MREESLERILQRGRHIRDMASDVRAELDKRMDTPLAADLALAAVIVIGALVIASGAVGIGQATQQACAPLVQTPLVQAAPDVVKPALQDTWALSPFPMTEEQEPQPAQEAAQPQGTAAEQAIEDIAPRHRRRRNGRRG